MGDAVADCLVEGGIAFIEITYYGGKEILKEGSEVWVKVSEKYAGWVEYNTLLNILRNPDYRGITVQFNEIDSDVDTKILKEAMRVLSQRNIGTPSIKRRVLHKLFGGLTGCGSARHSQQHTIRRNKKGHNNVKCFSKRRVRTVSNIFE